jgi:hypothetical protein
MDKTWKVTVKVEGREPFVTTVHAPEQAGGWTGLAQTHAMHEYLEAGNRLNGQLVTYEVEEV